MRYGIALVGYGRWGQNHGRVLNELGVLSVVCDHSQERRKLASEVLGVPVVADVDAINPAKLDGVVIAASASTHAKMVEQFLNADLDVFVEKPLALTPKDGDRLVNLARERNRVLQVGHILEYHPARQVIEEQINSGTLGELLSLRTVRVNLGTIRSVEDIVYSFAPHDIAFALWLGRGMPRKVTAVGFDLFQRKLADTAVLVLEFQDPVRLSAQITVSWLEPKKEHRSILAGTKGMLVWNDTKGERSLTLHTVCMNTTGECPVVSAEGETTLEVPAGEPLKAELSDFLSCIETRKSPRAHGESGAAVLKVMDAAQRSATEGRTVELNSEKRDFFVHETAVVDEGASIGKGTKIWHFCHVMPDTRIGNGVVIGQNCFVGTRSRIGDGVHIQNNVSVYDDVHLEKDVFVGPSAVFTNVKHPRGFVNRKDAYDVTLVKNGASLGANSTVVCGNTVGEFAFVAAGAVVSKDVPAFALVAGVPARRIGWVCKCGETLQFVGDHSTCDRCGERYVKSQESESIRPVRDS